ncbi:tRNA 2-methylthioadenosine synthase MiaB [Neokomagataea thailandica NBRC 106555]|uniref:MiaB/RimO family radical SAM methylthiotransferase n=2 Tax=Neokomagataea TaxID=1223423 RepID=A0A4Y6V7T2_9PROT|nr:MULTISPECIES: MiaB/RimO family radical SAM methylthiotransferase [Neokomagataea]QDH24740.1 MiaB/RimO family radical SAM methylthiotransferase [Neokomagataea tanensis]GBR53706.1 tRNA 2-methylthioadenosine synthase MiaB [Neokomagataea thailandica NBRC 106555]
MTSPKVLTFGCRLNAHESDVMAHLAEGDTSQETIIVNTCAVTATAERQARQAIRRAHRENPNAQIVVTGCASEVAEEKWASLPGVARVVQNTDKLNPKHWGTAQSRAKRPTTPPSRHARALLQVQQGCDHRCTFCIIPYGRGDSRSTPLHEALERAEALIRAGHLEIVLTGVDVASWRGPNGEGFGHICRVLLKNLPELQRLRLSSVDPVVLDPDKGDSDLWWLLENEPRLMPHLHLSLQAGSELILKRMKRRHTPRSVAHSLERIRKIRPEIGIGADLIAGFPTETEKLFQETLSFVEEQKIPFLHVFPYSERPETPAARMPAVANAERQARAARLRDAGERNKEEFLQRFIGTQQGVLIETPAQGHIESFAPLRLAHPEMSPPRGTIAPVRVDRIENGFLIGTLLS